MKIPDDVYENRCHYCMQFQDKPNDDVYMFAQNRPCNVFGLPRLWEVEGECRCFVPYSIFGICNTCEFKSWDKQKECQIEPVNRRAVYHSGDWLFSRWCHTCDKYQLRHGLREHIKREAAMGKIPKNFNPDTFEPIGEFERNELADRWAAEAKKYAPREIPKIEEERTLLSLLEEEK